MDDLENVISVRVVSQGMHLGDFMRTGEPGAIKRSIRGNAFRLTEGVL